MSSPVMALAADPFPRSRAETADPVDYPDMPGKLANALKDGRVAGAACGIGIAIAANRYTWIRPSCA
jgi:ribose 5-phosphate isomerase RpiB